MVIASKFLNLLVEDDKKGPADFYEIKFLLVVFSFCSFIREKVIKNGFPPPDEQLQSSLQYYLQLSHGENLIRW